MGADSVKREMTAVELVNEFSRLAVNVTITWVISVDQTVRFSIFLHINTLKCDNAFSHLDVITWVAASYN